jgi:predicted TPR repeat methyltransferase
MTPLDMLYEKNSDEFYDGTGNLVWLAALGFGYLLDENCSKIRNYLGPQICELGCGTGVAGIAALLFSSDDNDSPSSHVLFTDNDAKSLDLCQTNCELNDLEETQYSRHVLSWGEEPYPVSNVDTILATDVLYDMVMIPPLMETAATLLKDDGYALLSHIPRFCLPKREQEEDEHFNYIVREEESSFQAYQELEVHILDQAKQVGLVLVETIRLHQVLKTLPSTKQEALLSSPPHLSLELLEEMHAVLFVFQKKQAIT